MLCLDRSANHVERRTHLEAGSGLLGVGSVVLSLGVLLVLHLTHLLEVLVVALEVALSVESTQDSLADGGEWEHA